MGRRGAENVSGITRGKRHSSESRMKAVSPPLPNLRRDRQQLIRWVAQSRYRQFPQKWAMLKGVAGCVGYALRAGMCLQDARCGRGWQEEGRRLGRMAGMLSSGYKRDISSLEYEDPESSSRQCHDSRPRLNASSKALGVTLGKTHVGLICCDRHIHGRDGVDRPGFPPPPNVTGKLTHLRNVVPSWAMGLSMLADVDFERDLVAYPGSSYDKKRVMWGMPAQVIGNMALGDR